MKRKSKKSIPALVLCSFLLLDLLTIVLMTVFQISYDYSCPDKTKIYDLFSVADLEGTVFYMNGDGDIVNSDSKLTQLLSATTAKKQSKIKSYALLFALGKNDFVLYGKTVYKNNDDVYNSGQIKVFEKENTIYVIRFGDEKEPLSKENFSVYLVEDENFANEIIKFKARQNKYYVYSPSWLNDLMSFNQTGKILVLVVIVEVITVFAIAKIMNTKNKKPVKKKK